MKQRDIALIILIVFLSGVVSFFVSTRIFGTPASRQKQVEVVQPITTDFPPPDDKYFNNKAFDPTQPITIGQNANQNPFSSASQR